jgi:hypothetical protein
MMMDFYQPINLPAGEDYLYLTILDPTSKRYGTISLPMDVKKPTLTKP